MSHEGYGKSTLLILDDLTTVALTAFLGRVGIGDIKGVLRRRWQSEELSERQIEDFSSALILLYYHNFADREKECQGDGAAAGFDSMEPF